MGGLATVEIVLLVLFGLVLLASLLSLLAGAAVMSHARKRSPDAPRGYRPYPRLRKSRRPRA